MGAEREINDTYIDHQLYQKANPLHISTHTTHTPIHPTHTHTLLKAPPTPSPSFAIDGFAPLTPARFPNAKLSDDTAFNGAPSHGGNIPPKDRIRGTSGTHGGTPQGGKLI